MKLSDPVARLIVAQSDSLAHLKAVARQAKVGAVTFNCHLNAIRLDACCGQSTSLTPVHTGGMRGSWSQILNRVVSIAFTPSSQNT
jgi:hypothetical protein